MATIGRTADSFNRRAGALDAQNWTVPRRFAPTSRSPIGDNQSLQMTITQFTSTNLHDPVLPLVRAVPVALRASQTVAEAHAAVRMARRDLSAARRARYGDADAVDRVSRPHSLAALEHLRRPVVRLHCRPVRIAAAADRRTWREARTAVLLGLSCATVVALVVLAWRRDAMGALVVGGAFAGSTVAACLFGVLLPTLVRVFQVDPRIAAGPLVLAATDVVTLMFYLWLGTTVLHG